MADSMPDFKQRVDGAASVEEVLAAAGHPRLLRHPFIARDFGVDVCAVVSCDAGSRGSIHNISASWDVAPPQMAPKSTLIFNGSKSNPVEHPAHYGGADNPYETIKVIESMGAAVLDGFCRGNALKYLMRAGKKADPADQDLAKARWYLDYLVGYYGRCG